MEKITSILLFSFFFLSSYSYAQNSSAVEVYNGSIEVHSRTYLKGGNRKVIKLRIPTAAKGIYFAMYVQKSSDSSPARLGRKALLSAVGKNYKMGGAVGVAIIDDLIDMGQSRYENIDLYVLSNGYAASEFTERLNYDFSRIYEWEDLGNTTLTIPTNSNEFMYIGFHNTNPTLGLTVYVQAVAVY